MHHLEVAKNVAASVDLALSITLCKGESRWAGFAHAGNSGHDFVSREELEQTLGIYAWNNLSFTVLNSSKAGICHNAARFVTSAVVLASQARHARFGT
jgi:hypothetical protein